VGCVSGVRPGRPGSRRLSGFEYAQRLLDNIDKIDWPEKIKIAQRNWIGRSEGAEIDWQVKGLKEKIVTFTTRLDTIYGATFLVVAPEHKVLKKMKLSKEVKGYMEQALKKTEQKRKAGEKEKTGVDTGYKAVHPLTGDKLPIWVADFVLMEYGTGAIMAVPAHDERDLEMAKKFKLKVVDILKDKDEMMKELQKKKAGKEKVNYHLRDWLISRQRYWGPPIPMAECGKCGWQVVKEGDLPVELPMVKDYQPIGDGKSPLAKAEKGWLEVKCSKCGGKARRETDVSDTFLDSSWYFLRYPSVGEKDKLVDEELTKKWLPVEAYIGGAEHAVLHLLYSRFVWMALRDWGHIPKSLGDEPFPFLFGHGLIIKDGRKMSKSRGNVVVPDKYMDKYGVDTLRMYLMFIGPFEQGGDFQDTGMRGMRKFLDKVWRVGQKTGGEGKSLERVRHRTIKRVTEAVESFKYNVGISALMEYVNVLQAKGGSKQDLESLVILLAPLAPYLTEEMWKKLGGKGSVHEQEWPEFDEELVKREKETVVVQVNGKLRGRLELGREEAKDKDKVVERAKKDEKVEGYLKGKKIVKQVFVPGKLLNIVIE